MTSFTGVFARKIAIMEAIMGLKHKLVVDLLKTRVKMSYTNQTENEEDKKISY